MLVTLAESRQALQDHVARDRAKVYADFLQQVDNPTEPAGANTRSAVRRQGRRRLRILAEGDSWFKYPLGPPSHPLRDGVIFHLESLLGYPIVNMAEPGDEVRTMLGLKQREELISRLNDPNIHYDALLFSGGGNDLVGDQLCIWLKDTPPAPPPSQMLYDNAVNGALAVLDAEFRELARIRDRYSPNTAIFVNCYDVPAVTGIGVCGYGPWLKPSLDYVYGQMGVVPAPNDEYLVVKTVLKQFDAMLRKIPTSGVQNLVVVPTQGTLGPNKSDWQNEIHPSSKCFRKIAKKFQGALKAYFP